MVSIKLYCRHSRSSKIVVICAARQKKIRRGWRRPGLPAAEGLPSGTMSPAAILTCQVALVLAALPLFSRITWLIVGDPI